MDEDEFQKFAKRQGGQEMVFLTQQHPDREQPEKADHQYQVLNVIQPLPKIPPPFSQHLKRENEDQKSKNFCLCSRSYTLPFLCGGIVGNVGILKFMKDIVTKKRNLEYEIIEVSHNYSAIMTKDLITKREDRGELTIPCTIGMLKFIKAL